jgi:hypothetical protein
MMWNVMGVGDALRRLGEFLEECERAHAVDSVALAEDIEGPVAGRFSTEVTVTLSRDGLDGEATRLCATSVNADGTVRFGFETTDAVVPQTEGIAVEGRGATVDSDGSVRLTLSLSAPPVRDDQPAPDPAEQSGTDDPAVPDGETDGAGTDGGAGRSAADEDLPPFKNPQLLGEVYESCDTFAEMADTLEMDVTAETVRRYMIDFGIHEPNSYDTGDDSDDATEPDDATGSHDAADPHDATEPDDVPGPDDAEGTPPVLSDGIGLPEDITVETLIETVERSNTIYEVKRDLGVGREDALEMLRECNLLDLVMCRLATEAERDITREDVVERLRTASQAS